MGAVWFVNMDHTINKREDLHWTQSNTSSTTKTPIFFDDKFVERNSRHIHCSEPSFKTASLSRRINSANFYVEFEHRLVTPTFPLEESHFIN